MRKFSGAAAAEALRAGGGGSAPAAADASPRPCRATPNGTSHPVELNGDARQDADTESSEHGLSMAELDAAHARLRQLWIERDGGRGECEYLAHADAATAADSRSDGSAVTLTPTSSQLSLQPSAQQAQEQTPQHPALAEFGVSTATVATADLSNYCRQQISPLKGVHAALKGEMLRRQLLEERQSRVLQGLGARLAEQTGAAERAELHQLQLRHAAELRELHRRHAVALQELRIQQQGEQLVLMQRLVEKRGGGFDGWGDSACVGVPSLGDQCVVS